MELNVEYMVRTLLLALKGVPVTLGITAFSLLAAAPAAFAIALFRIHRTRGLSQAGALYTSFIRGTPMVLQILIVYSLLPSLLNSLVKGAGLAFDVFAVSPMVYALIVFTLSTVAGLAEVFRSALLTVSRGQLEAAQAIGMSTVQAYRRIIIPQALVVALPNLCNLTVSLIKGTSLAFLMTVKDITAIARVEAAYGYNYIESYIDIFILYILVCSLTQLAFGRLEKRLGAWRRLRTA